MLRTARAAGFVIPKVRKHTLRTGAARVEEAFCVARAASMQACLQALANALNAMALPLKITCSRLSKGLYRVQCGGAQSGAPASQAACRTGTTSTSSARPFAVRRRTKNKTSPARQGSMSDLAGCYAQTALGRAMRV